MTGLSKPESRRRWAEVRTLLCEWDPIGVMGDLGWPRDEYDCLIGPVLQKLDAGADVEQLAKYLHDEIQDHFGLDPKHYDSTSVAQRLLQWFSNSWRDR